MDSDSGNGPTRLLAIASGSSIALVVLMIGGWGLLAASGSDGCASVEEGAIVESEQFAPYGARYSGPIDDSPLLLSPASSAVPANAKLAVTELGGLPRRASVVAGESVYAYFLDRPVSDLKYNEFVRLGGIQLHQDPLTPGETFAAYLLDFAGERAVPVKVGPYVGALTWADPDKNGVRTHNVYWSDQTHNFSLIADKSAAAVVNLARSLICTRG